ncbi:phospholipase A2 group XV-like [Uranotaenia lowii]|uniref:phospholipase A2 group XV-like n=1 Tax=Uranotaenia lowii TaxID=190385 RepID=UPI0024783514|nr:phospholipase A2 group XV-like [Uranotaenia lowii]
MLSRETGDIDLPVPNRQSCRLQLIQYFAKDVVMVRYMFFASFFADIKKAPCPSSAGVDTVNFILRSAISGYPSDLMCWSITLYHYDVDDPAEDDGGAANGKTFFCSSTLTCKLEVKLRDLSIPRAVNKTLSPVILIPGDGGSRFEAKWDKNQITHSFCSRKQDNFTTIWLNPELLIWFIIDCLVDNLRLVYNSVTRTTSNSPGVSVRVPGWGNTETVEWLDPNHSRVGAYFVNLVNILVRYGYKRGLSIRGAPYDFRKAPNEDAEYRTQLKSLIEETYAINNDTAVTLVAHSLGAPVTLNFLQQQSQEWKDKYIRRLISLSGAWGGTVKAVKTYTIGDNLGSIFVDSHAVRSMLITTPSLAYLMPSPLFWNPNEIFVKTKSYQYTVANIDQFFKDLDLNDALNMYQDTLPYTLNFTAPQVEVHCWYATGKPTVDRLEWSNTDDMTSNKPKLIYGDGDGTVNLRSLTGCERWVGQQNGAVIIRKFPKSGHMGLLGELSILKEFVATQLSDLK